MGEEPHPQTADPQELARQLKQFVDVLSLVQTNSAEAPDIDKAIFGGAIPSMLRPLDPHTQFFDPGQFEQLRQMESAEQKGFGSIVSVLPGQVIFLQTLTGTPSNRAGIQAGDELVAIGSVMIGNLAPEQIIDLLTQARQQKISVLVRRSGSPRPMSFTLEPALVDAPSVDRSFMIAPGIAYIRVASWDLKTAKDLKDAIDQLGGRQLQGLVLDLRNNPGGIVTSALNSAALFLKPGQRILSARGRSAEVQAADVPANAKPYAFRVAIVLNEKTASASEIFAGALQDHDRAIVVGTPSYGKGLVQSVMPLSNGAGLALTTAFYYTPSGRSIQHPLRDSALSTTFGDEAIEKLPKYKTDSGRTVLGGGGIQPDVRVYPAGMNRLEQVLTASGVITQFATQYLATHPKVDPKFQVTGALLDDFKVFLTERQIQPTLAEWSGERTWVSARLREELVTQSQGVAQGDEIQMQTDPQVQAALTAVRNPNILAAK